MHEIRTIEMKRNVLDKTCRISIYVSIALWIVNTVLWYHVHFMRLTVLLSLFIKVNVISIV